jgi:hypothetical protein
MTKEFDHPQTSKTVLNSQRAFRYSVHKRQLIEGARAPSSPPLVPSQFSMVRKPPGQALLEAEALSTGIQSGEFHFLR